MAKNTKELLRRRVRLVVGMGVNQKVIAARTTKSASTFNKWLHEQHGSTMDLDDGDAIQEYFADLASVLMAPLEEDLHGRPNAATKVSGREGFARQTNTDVATSAIRDKNPLPNPQGESVHGGNRADVHAHKEAGETLDEIDQAEKLRRANRKAARKTPTRRAHARSRS